MIWNISTSYFYLITFMLWTKMKWNWKGLQFWSISIWENIRKSHKQKQTYPTSLILQNLRKKSVKVSKKALQREAENTELVTIKGRNIHICKYQHFSIPKLSWEYPPFIRICPKLIAEFSLWLYVSTWTGNVFSIKNMMTFREESIVQCQ